MKLKYTIVLISLFAIIILSCKNEKVSKQTLIGSWQETDVINAGDSIIQKVTFDKDTVVLETIYNGKVDGKLYNRMGINYTLSPDLKFIVLKKDTFQIKDEIIKLTSNELELRVVGEKHVFTFKRIN